MWNVGSILIEIKPMCGKPRMGDRGVPTPSAGNTSSSPLSWTQVDTKSLSGRPNIECMNIHLGTLFAPSLFGSKIGILRAE